MKNLNKSDLILINGGGKSLAYRAGQLIRFSILSRGSVGNLYAAISEVAKNEAL